MFQLDIEQEYNVSVKTLFSAWTETEQLKTWFCPEGMTMPEAYAHCHEGGDYRIHMRSPDGEDHIVSGIYQKVEPEKRLVFTWKWETSPHTTLVNVRFESLGKNRSKLTLSHSEFVEAESRDKHIEGWTSCLNKFRKYFV